MTPVQQTVYRSDDGIDFTNVEACLAHEKRMVDTKLFCVTHSPDLTEGRGYYGTTYILAEHASLEEIEDFCYRHFGRKVVYAMGVQSAKMNNWNVTEVDKKTPKHGSRVGDYENAFDMMTLIWSDSVQGFVDRDSKHE